MLETPSNNVTSDVFLHKMTDFLHPGRVFKHLNDTVNQKGYGISDKDHFGKIKRCCLCIYVVTLLAVVDRLVDYFFQLQMYV